MGWDGAGLWYFYNLASKMDLADPEFHAFKTLVQTLPYVGSKQNSKWSDDPDNIRDPSMRIHGECSPDGETYTCAMIMKSPKRESAYVTGCIEMMYVMGWDGAVQVCGTFMATLRLKWIQLIQLTQNSMRFGSQFRP